MKLLCGPDKKKAKKGFTLTELAIVIAVIAILIAVLVPTFSSIINKAKASNELVACNNEWTNYYIDANIAAEGTENDYLVVYTGNEYTNSGNTYYHGYLATKGSLDTETQLDLTVTDTYVSYNSEIFNPIGTYEYMAEGKITIYVNNVSLTLIEKQSLTIGSSTSATQTVDNSGLTVTGSGTSYYVSGDLSANSDAASEWYPSGSVPTSLFSIRIYFPADVTSYTVTGSGSPKTVSSGFEKVSGSNIVYDSIVMDGATKTYTVEYTYNSETVEITIHNNATYTATNN